MPVAIKTLTEELESIKFQIRTYPTPIAGCDEQFDYLLAEQKRLTVLLSKSNSPDARKVYSLSGMLGMKHIYPFLCRFVPTMKSIFRFACLTDDELRKNLYEMNDMIARNLLIGRR